MNAEEFSAAVEASTAAELGLLESAAVLDALTDAERSRGSVLDAAAHSERAAARTFAEWAAAEPDDAARAAFAALADQETDHFERVAARLESFEAPAVPGPMHAYLRGLDATIPRVGAGLVGRPLVSVRVHARIVAFFVDEDAPELADLFRDLRAETAAVIDTGNALLRDLVASDDDRERARAAAAYTIRLAYDDYADSLREAGVDPDSIR